MFSIFHRLITDIQKTKKGQAQEIWLLINCDPGWAIDSHQLWDFPNISKFLKVLSIMTFGNRETTRFQNLSY